METAAQRLEFSWKYEHKTVKPSFDQSYFKFNGIGWIINII